MPIGSYVQKWLQHEPELAVARLFLPALRTPRLEALACLEHEIQQALFGVREARVSEYKLQWWAGELDRAQPSHPLTQRLHALGWAQAERHHLLPAVALAVRVSQLAPITHLQQLLGPLAEMQLLFSALRANRLPAEPAGSEHGTALAAAVLLTQMQRGWSLFANPERGWVPLETHLAQNIERHSNAYRDPRTAQAASLFEGLRHALQPHLADLPQSPLHGLDGARWHIARFHLAQAAAANTGSCIPAPAPHWRLTFRLWRYARRENRHGV